MGERPPGRYGIDAPRLLVIPILLVVVAVAQAVLTLTPWPLIGAAAIVACMGSGWYTARRGKFRVWAEILDGVGLQGDEQVVDIGCGRGAVLVLAAQRLETGRAVGVDLWTHDQSGNSADATRRNMLAAGVADRVELQTADMTDLPLPSAAFDVVLSNVAVHNCDDPTRAIVEMQRVLRPGGRLLVADLRKTKSYQHQLEQLGFEQISRTNLGPRMWWSGPWLPTHLVRGTRP